MEYHPLAEKQMKAATDEKSFVDIANASNNSMTAAPSNSTVPPPPPSFFQPSKPVDRSSQKPSFFTSEEIESFDRDGFLVLPAERVWDLEKELAGLLHAVDNIDYWYEAPGEKMLQRIENFAQYSPVLDRILNQGKLIDMCTDLFNEKAILYKEKINFKLPGAIGFEPHQDVAAGWWMYNQSLHISVLVSIDASNAENGALEVVRGKHHMGILGEAWKEVAPKYVEEFKWEMVNTKPGDVVFFDSFVPHRSAPNSSSARRRILYATYAKESEGDYRDQYYADKRKSFPPDCERDAGKKYEYKI